MSIVKNARDAAALQSFRDRVQTVADGLATELRADETSVGMVTHVLSAAKLAGVVLIGTVSLTANVVQILDRYSPAVILIDDSCANVSGAPSATGTGASADHAVKPRGGVPLAQIAFQLGISDDEILPLVRRLGINASSIGDVLSFEEVRALQRWTNPELELPRID